MKEFSLGYVTKEEIECKSCGRVIRKGKFQFDAPEGRICLDCHYSRRASIKEWHEAPIFEILKFIGLMILFLVFLSFLLAGALFVITVFYLGANIGEAALAALTLAWLLINPFLIFELFGWIGIGVWLVILFVIPIVIGALGKS